MKLGKFPILVKRNDNSNIVYLWITELIILLIIHKKKSCYHLDIKKEFELNDFILNNEQTIDSCLLELKNKDLIRFNKEKINRKNTGFLINRYNYFINTECVISKSLDEYNLNELIYYNKNYMYNKSFILKRKDNSTELRLNYKQALFLKYMLKYKTIKQSDLYYNLKELDLVTSNPLYRHYLKFFKSNKIINFTTDPISRENTLFLLTDEIDYIIDDKFIKSVDKIELFLFGERKENKYKIKLKNNNKLLDINKHELLILSLLKINPYRNCVELYRDVKTRVNISLSYVRKLVSELIIKNLVTILKQWGYKFINISCIVDKDSIPDKISFLKI